MSIRILVIGGEHHDLRIPMMIALRNRGFEVIAAGSGPGDGFEQLDIEYHRYNYDRFNNIFSDLKCVTTLRKIIKKTRADVIQTFDTKLAVFVPVAACWIGRTKVIRTVNGLGWLYSTDTKAAIVMRYVYEFLFRVTSPMTVKAVFQNYDDWKVFCRRKLLTVNDGCVIPGSGLDTKRFREEMKNQGAANIFRDALLGKRRKIVLTVTRLNRIKGIPTLLKAAATVHKLHPEIYFVLVGSRESEGKLAITDAELKEHEGYVTAVGYRDDTPAFFSIADVFVFPTELREGIPRVLLEAGAAGVPIVTTKMPGCTDIVEDGVSGYLYDPGKADQLASKILECLDNPLPAKLMSMRAQKKIEEKFHLDIVVDQYAEIYRKYLYEDGLEKNL